MRWSAILLSLPLLCACDPSELPADVFAVGDSYLSWHRESGESIPQVAAHELGLEPFNLAIGGSQVLEGPRAIPDQYIASDWPLVVVDGGGNDLRDDCACEACGPTLDKLIGPEGETGAFVDLVDEMVDRGSEVVVVGYGEVRADAGYGFGACDDDFAALGQRQALVASSRPEVTFVDLRPVLRADDLSAWADDRLHPSPEGSALAGKAVADAISGGVPTPTVP